MKVKMKLSPTKGDYRSLFEREVARDLWKNKVDHEYESMDIYYTQPPRTYTPDFILRGKKKMIIIEAKGRFLSRDRTKHLLIKEQNPDLDIRFVFQNSKNKLRKGSKTTYAGWCDKHGFLYADKRVPKEWIRELNG